MPLNALSESPRMLPQMLRSLFGGALMGVANLVPGISGGTMLLAVGVYPQFIRGIAEVTTLRFKPRTLALLGAIIGAGAIVIVALAGPVKTLVVDHRWVMYSLFIGLTLGGVPVVWRLLRPFTAAAGAGTAAGILVMAAMAVVQPGAAGAAGDHSYGLLFFAGLAGASAMILPGVSGGYLLLILGQYITILRAIDDGKKAVLGSSGPDWAALAAPMHVFVPVGLGVAIGVIGVSNLLRVLLARFEKATLGVLLGLLLGAVLGLWPFQQGTPPQPGQVVNGVVMTAERVAEIAPEDYPLERFSPSGGQIASALGLIVAGFVLTQAVALAGAGGEGRQPAERPEAPGFVEE